ncbi:MAG: ABC transporter ATP-binding protein [Lachnospiraceae bacterium]|nr:ABC transporter ATP-binding protein [Lachnospiraceae bacterium]
MKDNKDIPVEFSHFGFKYTAQQDPTLYDIDLCVRKGEKILIAGPSGCGKSTVVSCINGLIPFSYKGEMSGSLKVAGKETSGLGLFEISQTVGTVLQDTDAQFVGMTVAEDIAFALENSCVIQDEMKKKVLHIAGLVNVQDHLHFAPGELSGGQKQRVSVAGVMVDDVDVLLFDEPLANLDPATGREAIELIDELQKKTGAAVIIVEHRLEDVLWRHVDRVVLMSRGRIISDTDADTLLCSDLLLKAGVREPLYVRALKFAGVSLTPEKKPADHELGCLDENDRELVRKWFCSVKNEAPPKRTKPLLEVKDLVFSYEKRNKRALDGISVTINEGEMTAIVGTNGAGKSTFSKVVCGFETGQSGALSFDGRDLSALSMKERAEHIGYVMQDPNHMISQTMIFDEVALGLRNRGAGEEEIKKRVEDVLKVCGLYRMRNWPISALSYGQKKRVTIAAILVLKPKMLILDEPTAGQDYRHYTEIMEFLTDLRSQGITIIMITHDMHLMIEYAERAIVFSDGRIIADDDPAAVITDRDIIKTASLRETSLYRLSESCGIDDGTAFVRRFIACEKEERRSDDKPL